MTSSACQWLQSSTLAGKRAGRRESFLTREYSREYSRMQSCGSLKTAVPAFLDGILAVTRLECTHTLFDAMCGIGWFRSSQRAEANSGEGLRQLLAMDFGVL